MAVKRSSGRRAACIIEGARATPSLLSSFSMALRLQVLCFISLTIGASAEVCGNEGSLRLVGWMEADAGRIEVCHNLEWGTICVNESLDLWPHKNAEVACRDIGYAGALNSLFHHTIASDKRVGEDSEVPIHFSRMRCSGEQKSLLDCPLSEVTEQCSHNQDAAIVCRRGRAKGILRYKLSAGDVRLVGDTRDTVGAVELYHPDLGWTGICADANHVRMWTENQRAAETVCAQLGYLGGTPYIQSLHRSAVTKRKVVVGSCDSRNIFDLTDCELSTIGDCSSDDLAWVECSPTGRNGDVSKLGSDGEGVMEVQYGGRRGFICDNEWDNIDAQAACWEFDQYNLEADTSPEGDYTEFISDLKPIWLGGIECTDKIDYHGSVSRRVVVESEIEDCDRSEKYPIGLTECNFVSESIKKQRLAQIDCGDMTITSSVVAIIAGVCAGALFLCCCCTCTVCFCCDEHTKRTSGSKTVCERMIGKDCCQVPSPVIHCVHAIHTKLRSQKRTSTANERPTTLTTTNVSRYTAATTHIPEQKMTAVTSENPAKEASERSSAYFTPREEQKELTSASPPSYAQSSIYPAPSLSKIQTTV